MSASEEDYGEDFLAEMESALMGGGVPPDADAAVAAVAGAAGIAEGLRGWMRGRRCRSCLDRRSRTH